MKQALFNFSAIQTVTVSDNGKKYYVPAGLVPPGETDIRTLTSDITEIYEEEPHINRRTDTVDREELLNKKDLKSVKDSSQVLWYYVIIDNKEGWIKEAELDKISAYNWKAFGFEVLRDEADEFLYDPKSPTPFLNKLCSYIEGQGDKFLTTGELQAAFRDPAKKKKVSRLVCYHSSEWYWGQRSGEFKAEIEKLFEEGIKKEERPAEQQKLIQKKDDILKALETRLKSLCFWTEITNVPQGDSSWFDDAKE